MLTGTNCLTGNSRNYPSAPNQVRKNPNIERNTTAPFDTDDYSQKASMRDNRGAVIPERDIYANPKREVRDYPIPLFIDSYRDADKEGFINGRIALDFVSMSGDGITVQGQVRNVKHMELKKIRLPIAPSTELGYYNKFSLEVAPIGTSYNEYANNSNLHFHFMFSYEVDPQSADHYLLTPDESCFECVPQPVVENMTFTFRTPFEAYPLYLDGLFCTINPGSPLPAVLVFNAADLGRSNLMDGDAIVFVCPSSKNPAVNTLIGSGGPYVANNVDLVNNTFETLPVIDASAISSTIPLAFNILIPKNRIIFPLMLTGMKN